MYAVLCVEKAPYTEWLGLIPKSNPKPEEKEESAAPIAVDASSDAAASPATEGSDAKKSPSSNANGDSVDKSTHGSPVTGDGSSPAKFTGEDLSKASQPAGRVDPSFDDEGLNPDDRMFNDEDLDAPYVNVTALQCRRIKVVPGGEFDEKTYHAVFDHPELQRYVDASSGGKPPEGQLRVAFVTWDGLAGLGGALCGSSHPTRNKCTLYARPKEGDEGIREHGIALGVIPQNARVRVSFCSAVPDGSFARNPTGQSDATRSHVIQPYPPVSDSPWTIHRNFLSTAPSDGTYESVELVFDGVAGMTETVMTETDVVALSKSASRDVDMSDAEAQAVPFVEFELSRHAPPTRNVEPETKLPGEQRAKGRVVFHYLYHGRQMRKTELTTGFTCPFCLCVNRDFDGMSRHLEACHDAFNFEFLPKVQNEADPRVHVVCRSEEEVRPKGTGEVRKESARRKEASEWFFKHGGWFVQSKAKVQMTHHELDDDGGVVRKDVSPTCADREFVYASTRYRMPRWLQHQRSQHHASVSAPGPRVERRRLDDKGERAAQLKQRAAAAEIQHQLKIQRHQLEQLQRHRHQQFAGRHRLVGDINHILTPQVHPGLLNHLMLNQGPGGQLGMQQGLQLGGQLGGLGAFAGGISGLNTVGISGLNTNAAYGLGLGGMDPTHQLQQQQLQQQQMQQQQQLQQLLLRQQGHQQHQPFPPRKDVIRAWVEHRLQDVDPVALARELGITPREIEAGDGMIRELRGHMSILTEAHAAAGKVLDVPKPKPKPTRPPIGPAYTAGVPPPDDDVHVRGDPSSPTNFVNLTGAAAAADDDDVFEHDERVRHRRKTRDLDEVTRAAPRRYKKMEKWSTRDVGRPKKPKTTEVPGVKAPGLDFLMEAVTEDRGADAPAVGASGKDKDKGASGKDKGAGKDKRKFPPRMADEDQPRQKRQYTRRDKPDKPAGSQPPAKRPGKCSWSKGIIGSHYDISEDPKKQAQWGGVGPPGTFYHAKTCVPIEPIVSPVNTDEVNTDSDDDEDLHAWAKEDLRHLSDFEDVAPLEKKFMHDWNVFVRRFRPCADREIPDCLKAFARFKGKDLAGHRALRRLFTLHLINAYDFGVIESRVIDDVLKVVDEHRGDVKR